MKKTIAILLMLVMLVMLVGGCVSQQDYDSLMVEYDALRVRVESAESNLAAAQGDFAAEQSKAVKLESDLAAEQSNIQTLENDLISAQAQIETLEDGINKVENDVATAQRQLSELRGIKTELSSLWDSLQKKLVVQQGIVYFWATVSLLAAGDISETEATIRTLMFLAIGADIEEVEDAELSQLWEDFITYAQQEKEAEMLSSLGALTKRVNDLIDQDSEWLDTRVNVTLQQ